VVETDHPLLVPVGELTEAKPDGGIRQSRTTPHPDEGPHPLEQDEVGHRHRQLEDVMIVHRVLDSLGRLKGDTVPRTGVDPGRIARIRNTVEGKMIVGKGIKINEWAMPHIIGSVWNEKDI